MVWRVEQTGKAVVLGEKGGSGAWWLEQQTSMHTPKGLRERGDRKSFLNLLHSLGVKRLWRDWCIPDSPFDETGVFLRFTSRVVTPMLYYWRDSHAGDMGTPPSCRMCVTYTQTRTHTCKVMDREVALNGTEFQESRRRYSTSLWFLGTG